MNRIALVTGGAKRIGRQICLDLAANGYGVVVHYHRSETEAQETRDDCIRAGASGAWVMKGDLSSIEDRSSLIVSAASLAGSVDLLINSASAFEYDTVHSFTAEALNHHLQTNYLAAVELTMALFAIAKDMETERPAHVVTLLDQKVFNLNIDYMTYTLAKLASHASIRYLAQCCAPFVRVNALAPGVTMVSGEMTPQEFGHAHRIAALGRSSNPSDIAHAVLLLDQAQAVTGQTIAVDGGQHLVPRRRDVAFEE